MSRTERDAYRNYLKEKELEVLELELNARKQKALLDLKRDFISEVDINDKYLEYYKIEQEKYLERMAKEKEVVPEIFEVKED